MSPSFRRVLLGSALTVPLLAGAVHAQNDPLFTPVTPGDPAAAARALGLNIPLPETEAAGEAPTAEEPAEPAGRTRLRDEAAPPPDVAAAGSPPPEDSFEPAAAEPPIEPPAGLAQPQVFDRSQPRQVVQVAPSRTELIPVASDHLNRIVTPFDKPVIQTVASEEEMQTRIEGSIIYIALNKTQTIFIHEDGEPENAIGLALVPRMMPPREIVLSAAGTSLAARRGDFGRAMRAPSRPPVASGRATPHVQQIHDIIVDVAKGNVPDGFRLFEAVTDVRGSDVCRADLPVNFDFSKAQMMVNDTHVVLIARAQLRGSRPLDLQEVWCAAQPSTVGVAFYPYTELTRQGQDTEVYVVLRRDQYEEARPTRRRLVTIGD